MAKIIRVFLSLFIAPAALYAFEPALDAIFKTLGFNTESWAISTMSWIRTLTMSSWFSYIALAGASVCLGAWAHYWASQFDFRKSQKFKALATHITNLKNEIWDKAKAPDGSYHFSSPDRQLKGKVAAISFELRQAGIDVPDFNALEGPQYSILVEHYLMAIEPFAEFGQISSASKAGLEKYENTIRAFAGIDKDMEKVGKMTNLKQARDKGKIEDFIKEHEADPEGDLDKLDETIKRPAREKMKATRPASSEGDY